ncbi:MAG: FHIPEP family type III secretion protein, partial [Burkholderiales bacterium]
MPANNKFLALTQNKELSIVFLVLIVLCMLIIPLPTEVMDVLIMFNITVSIIVLMVVIYMDSPLKLTAFPSILLILAMLRIGITISTSRLILLDADAGKIVETFGNFVVSGSLVVGVVIFTMITIINFIVITKGSERVAEVAARFSLDAMPGKQMSIDSDLRSGTIDMEEANQRRKDLNLESKLYGAMDGAMKFVKGDAIASIIDILVNLVGGFIVGIVEHDMTLGKSISTYSILTIGDGLVQQIPTLLVSLTAGMMITKVSDESEQLNLGESVLKQVFSNRKAIIASSIMLIIMALVPGMPSVTIGVFFVILLIIIKFMHKKDKA